VKVVHAEHGRNGNRRGLDPQISGEKANGSLRNELLVLEGGVIVW
jgi:hypothetical protein